MLHPWTWQVCNQPRHDHGVLSVFSGGKPPLCKFPAALYISPLTSQRLQPLVLRTCRAPSQYNIMTTTEMHILQFVIQTYIRMGWVCVCRQHSGNRWVGITIQWSRFNTWVSCMYNTNTQRDSWVWEGDAVLYTSSEYTLTSICSRVKETAMTRWEGHTPNHTDGFWGHDLLTWPLGEPQGH